MIPRHGSHFAFEKTLVGASRLLAVIFIVVALAPALAQSGAATLDLDFTKKLGSMEMDRIGLGQGGLSPNPMWDSRIAEIRALRPHLIRLFVSEYFNISSPGGKYHFTTLDQSVNEIVRAGAIPLMCIAIKPKALFPKIDQDQVDPNDYGKWEELISAIVNHYKQQGLREIYWEVGNEGDIGELGGSPYRFTPEDYVRYYRHTAAAILRADPKAHVGGPALASCRSAILPALLSAADGDRLPLSFVSWHIYSSDPKAIQTTIEYVKDLLAQHPSLHPETILDEWNMALTAPPKDPRIQPAFVAETAWRMKQSGLTYSCYYHIRDYHVDRDLFASTVSSGGASFMASWWNRMPQYSGLFDYQNVMRPAYFTFDLLARVTGDRLEAESDDDSVHAFLAYDKLYNYYSLMFWNFSATPVSLTLRLHGLPGTLTAHRRMLDAETPSQDENARLRPLDDVLLAPDAIPAEINLAPYEIQFWSLEPLHWRAQIMNQAP
ncbi:putative Xylan 1,4-beta-xylosidase [Candidatus Sulfotelmatomonas gaucii]|uniref:Putative Xylan 1,4-beta-xylosidase n=1 Tax=Candidatus Sulfuritelmatomonas gaucii TaxID=2043161 RepID=A0A2N9L369_9BACT|nr:putative Xylan 1,4-beta-xylosidase [Candidatus Sulfotelmatomonas gaucii]